jgi:uncharacterized protein (TIGR02117 family)
MARAACSIALLFLVTGCLGPIKSLYPPAPGAPTRSVYVVNQGTWHTGIALEAKDVPERLWAVKRDYPNARYLEVGWGDYDAYTKDLTCWITFKAAIWPTRSVLQLDGFAGSLDENFDDPRSTIIEIKLSERGFERLCKFIGETHVLDEHGRAIALGDDWYESRGRYCVLNTCNTWVAKALRSAGCPITPIYCITRGPLLRQAKKFGHILREPVSPPGKASSPSDSR